MSLCGGGMDIFWNHTIKKEQKVDMVILI